MIYKIMLNLVIKLKFKLNLQNNQNSYNKYDETYFWENKKCTIN
jgi:hypothetical protein